MKFDDTLCKSQILLKYTFCPDDEVMHDLISSTCLFLEGPISLSMKGKHQSQLFGLEI